MADSYRGRLEASQGNIAVTNLDSYREGAAAESIELSGANRPFRFVSGAHDVIKMRLKRRVKNMTQNEIDSDLDRQLRK